jgi:hypothetical protein
MITLLSVLFFVDLISTVFWGIKVAHILEQDKKRGVYHPNWKIALFVFTILCPGINTILSIVKLLER